MLEQTGCSAVMIARGAIGNPWIFKRTKEYLRTGSVPPPPGVEERLAVALEHARLNMEQKGDVRGLREMRKHVANYTKGLWCGARLREAIYEIERYDAMEALLEEYLETLSRREEGRTVVFRPRPGDPEKEAVGA